VSYCYTCILAQKRSSCHNNESIQSSRTHLNSGLPQCTSCLCTSSILSHTGIHNWNTNDGFLLFPGSSTSQQQMRVLVLLLLQPCDTGTAAFAHTAPHRLTVTFKLENFYCPDFLFSQLGRNSAAVVGFFSTAAAAAATRFTAPLLRGLSTGPAR
jgi:hypothetical protein